ncbi:response regulator [Methanoregula sp. UBA64]|jgi:CheY-like chemotaxis protein|uniref:response regulator n=1 Tax=Methanoregula sp. UBA64 TaxID=1915554 RepID=UPI0025D2D6EB|nr:response regulator [Methanoregula sp. UBA64]
MSGRIPMIRMLYIDADPEMCQTVSAFCDRLETIRAKTLGSGEAALEWLLCSPADIIVSEYRFPGGIDGITFTRRLRLRGNRTPVILFTAGTSRALKKEAARNGIFKVVSRTRQGKNPVLPLIRTVFWALT